MDEGRKDEGGSGGFQVPSPLVYRERGEAKNRKGPDIHIIQIQLTHDCLLLARENARLLPTCRPIFRTNDFNQPTSAQSDASNGNSAIDLSRANAHTRPARVFRARQSY